ncbi:hypothetical protein EJF18_40299 [Clavispora lusitaniae]|uniref:Uncharacterized protein n=2 Tax=Clavispora lusitaniae TaxID=36911 RepID=C4Y5S0_CLAL4|nr:uncharacterized protein CLUG_03504 [Clavispora lusitaniae ATCC 42720]KAF7582654.1 hypothetical protein FOB63_002735 [Clavispora lusitaniae]EEQ39376.1 predicted protein [Clavispora lusitaniae ATCC 42720]QFZ28266.1 hypothetical protein EJF14_40299 [Clavispora lusitaniae]QFZ33929.1 hypothetical protein EJF16_40299 [Clavispora lusitaniae]QFZ39613.1 hypothetical protein EJF15_40299 [Clavispora lusitaniae]
MVQTITKKDKEELLKGLRALKKRQIAFLVAEADRISKKCENKVARRLNNVSVTFQKVKLSQILQLERQHSPTLADFRKISQDTQNSR